MTGHQSSAVLMQGSVLDLVLFLTYINNLPDAPKSCVNLFTDDTKQFGIMTTDGDGQAQQSDLRAVMDWSDEWELAFNSSKCSDLHLNVMSSNACNCNVMSCIVETSSINEKCSSYELQGHGPKK